MIVYKMEFDFEYLLPIVKIGSNKKIIEDFKIGKPFVIPVDGFTKFLRGGIQGLDLERCFWLNDPTVSLWYEYHKHIGPRNISMIVAFTGIEVSSELLLGYNYIDTLQCGELVYHFFYRLVD